MFLHCRHKMRLINNTFHYVPFIYLSWQHFPSVKVHIFTFTTREPNLIWKKPYEHLTIVYLPFWKENKHVRWKKSLGVTNSMFKGNSKLNKNIPLPSLCQAPEIWDDKGGTRSNMVISPKGLPCSFKSHILQTLL